MLVLSRKLNELLLIDGDIQIKVLSVQGSRVKIGVEAPKHFGVRRAELETSDLDPTECGVEAIDTTMSAGV